MRTARAVRGAAILVALGAILAAPNPAVAHCDGMDGPVVNAAQEALATGNVDLVLVWVQESDEQEIRQAFDRTLKVRTLSAEAREFADMYFFETLVRVHRAGEGAPYTGLKPAGRDLGPAIPLADQVLSTGKVGPLVMLITDEMRRGLTERFGHAVGLRNHSPADVEAGREYVHAYVSFVHFVERAYEAASQPVPGHFPEDRHSPEPHVH